MMGYGLDSDGLHSPNEHYSIEMFERGIETAIVYLEEWRLACSACGF
jgi:acetylornithine deacetylase/succinyl-diaminopimelate desuccinylase-like protein